MNNLNWNFFESNSNVRAHTEQPRWVCDLWRVWKASLSLRGLAEQTRCLVHIPVQRRDSQHAQYLDPLITLNEYAAGNAGMEPAAWLANKAGILQLPSWRQIHLFFLWMELRAAGVGAAAPCEPSPLPPPACSSHCSSLSIAGARTSSSIPSRMAWLNINSELPCGITRLELCRDLHALLCSRQVAPAQRTPRSKLERVADHVDGVLNLPQKPHWKVFFCYYIPYMVNIKQIL